MWHEISQYDIPDRELLVTKAKPSVGRWKDIGEAKITHTIFGKARVHIIREQDKLRRARLLTALAVVALATAAWQGWVAMNQTPPPPVSARIQVSAPAFQPEYLPTAAAPSSAGSKPATPPQTVTINPAASRKSATQQALGLKTAEQIAAKPVASQPLAASKPRTTALDMNSNLSKPQADMQQIPALSAPIQPATAVVKAPIAAQPAASSTTAVASQATSLVKEVTPISSPAGSN